jgi:hypothetical protein
MSAGEDRLRGNALFAKGEFASASAAYTRALRVTLRVPDAGSGPAPADAADAASLASAVALCGAGEIDAAVVSAALARVGGGAPPPSSAQKDEVAVLLLNRAQASIKLSSYGPAMRDCSAVLSFDPGNMKALYRRALCYEACGRVREALSDAMRMHQLDKTHAQAVELLRRLRTAASVSGGGTGAAAPSGGALPRAPGGAMGGGSGPLPLSACLAFLAEADARAAASPPSSSPSSSSTSASGLTPAALDRCIRSLQGVLTSATPVRAFLSADGARKVAAAAFPPTPLAGSTSSTGPPVVTPTCNLLIGIAGRISEECATVWHREWDGERSSGGLTLADTLPVQAALVDALVAPVVPHVLLLAADIHASPSSLPLTSAAVRVGASLLCGAFSILRPQLQAQTLTRLRQWKAIKAGTLTTAAPLPKAVKAALRAWATCVTASLSGIGPIVGGGGGGTPTSAFVHLCLQALGQASECEEAVQVLDRAGALAAASVYLASDVQELARTSAGALSRALTVLRDSHPRGHMDVGRAKVKQVLTRVAGPCVAALAAALPFKPDDKKDGSGESSSGPELFVVPSTLPDWQPSPDTARVAALLQVALLIDRDTGLWFADQQGVLVACFITCVSSEERAQAVGAEVVATMCSDEQGRSLLTTLPQRIISADPSYATRLDILPLLQRLSASPFTSIRASAAVTLAKLTAPSKSFSSAEGASGRDEMLSSVLTLFKTAAGILGEEELELDDEEDEEEEEEMVPVKKASAAAPSAAATPQPAFRHLVAAVKASWGKGAAPGSFTSAMGGSSSGAGAGTSAGSDPKSSASSLAAAAVAGVDLDAAARAVEALAVLATHTAIKARLAEEESVRALLAIGASLVAHVELQHAMILRERGVGRSGRPGEGDDDDEGARRGVISGRGGVIDLSKVSAGAWETATRSSLRPTVYGLAHIIYSVVTSRQRQQEAKLAELEVDMDQWKELQRLATPPGADPAAGVEMDPPAAVEARARALLRGDVFHLLVGLADAAHGLQLDDDEAAAGESAAAAAGTAGASSSAAGSGSSSRSRAGLRLDKDQVDGRPLPPPVANTSRNGAATRELLSLTLLSVTEWVWARGLLVQAGGIPLLLDLVTEGQATHEPGGAPVSAAVAASGTVSPLNTFQGALAACQALARIFITTNPALLPPAYVHDSVKPLLRLARDSSLSLAQFEAGLALGNVASAGPEVREVMLRRRALAALEYLQFSDHKLVRRAGTEALTNLSTSDEGARLITLSRLHLWLALARSFQAPGARIADGSEVPVAARKRREKVRKDLAAAKKGHEAMRREKEQGKQGSNAGAVVAADGGQEKEEAAEAAAAAAAEEEEEDATIYDEDQDRDTPTAMAAAGGLAMACMHLMSDLETEAEAKAAVECAERLVRAGCVSVMCELLMSGTPGLVHRAATVLELLAGYPVGAAALLTPLVALEGEADEAEGEGEGEGGDEDDEFFFRGAARSVHAFLLLHLLSQGRDLAALAGALGAGARRQAMAASAGGVQAAVAAVCRGAVEAALAQDRDDVEAASRAYNEGREAAKAEEVRAKAEREARAATVGEGGSTSGAGGEGGVEPGESGQAWRAVRLVPEWPADELVDRILAERE